MAMLEWNSYRQQIKVRIGEIAKLSPDTIKGYQALTAAWHVCRSQLPLLTKASTHTDMQSRPHTQTLEGS
jgi:hypothetical protein